MTCKLARWSAAGTALAAAALAHAAAAAEIHFRTSHEEAVVKNRFRPGDRVPLGGYPVEIGYMETFTEDAWIEKDPSCDPLSTLGLIIDGSQRAGEIRGMHTMADEPKGVYHFKVQIGAERTDVFGASFGTISAATGYPFYFVQFGGDGTIWVMDRSTGIPYRNVFASDCPAGIDNRVKVGWKMNFDDKIFTVEVMTFGPGATRQTFGPFPIPKPLLDEGWDHCIYRIPPETGRYYFDGVLCASAASPEFDPTSTDNTTRR